MKLLTHEGWPYQPNLCKYDDEFIEFVSLERLNTTRIFHMGPGLHHSVGKQLSERHSVMSITISPEEMQTYVDLVTEQPEKTKNYTCIFGDIYTFNFNLTRNWDIISLPHLGETPDETRNQYADKSDAGLLIELVNYHLTLGGYIALYEKSSAADRIIPLADINNRLEFDSWYGSVRLYKKV